MGRLQTEEGIGFSEGRVIGIYMQLLNMGVGKPNLGLLKV